LTSGPWPEAAVAGESFAVPTRHHGDSPMMRNWKLLGLDLILAGALTAPVAAGQTDGVLPQEGNKDDLVLKEVRELKSAISDLTKAIKSMQDTGTNSQLKMEKTQ